MVDANPYPWPYDGRIVPERLAVVVAGAQGAWARCSLDPAAASATIARLVDAVRGTGGHVVYVRHHCPGLRRPVALPPLFGSSAWQLLFDPVEGDVVVDAGGVDSFHASPLDDHLRARGVDQLILCGYAAELAVDSTLRSANDRGYECVTVADAVAPIGVDTGRHALASITMSGGIFGAVASSTALLRELDRLSRALEVHP